MLPFLHVWNTKFEYSVNSTIALTLSISTFWPLPLDLRPEYCIQLYLHCSSILDVLSLAVLFVIYQLTVCGVKCVTEEDSLNSSGAVFASSTRLVHDYILFA